MKIRTWFRVVLPKNFIGSAILGYVFLVMLSIGIQMLIFRVPFQFPLPYNAGIGLLCFLAFAYGIFRVGFCHPVFRKEYRDWLHRTPWQFGLPLPAGPVQFVPQDLLVIAVLTGLSLLHQDVPITLIPSLFLTSYLAVVTSALLLTRQNVHVFLLLFGFGAALYLDKNDVAIVSLLTFMAVIGWHGLQESLRTFHNWNLDVVDEKFLPLFDSSETVQEVMRKRILGWPYDRLAPRRFPATIPFGFAFAIAGLVGWWLGGFMSMTAIHEREEYLGFLLALGTLTAGVRTFLYIWGYAPPISLWGRLVTFRFIIRSYDIIFVAPLLVIIIPATLTSFFAGQPETQVTLIPFCASLQILIALKCPPSLDRWRLTGNHRIVPATSFVAAELQQTQ